MRLLPAALALVLLVAPPALAAELRGEARDQAEKVEDALEKWDLFLAHLELDGLKKLGADEDAVKYLEGRIAFEEGRYEDAIELLEAAGVDDRPGSYLRLAKDTAKVVGSHQKVEGKNFDFYFPKGKDEILAPYALEALEQIRAALEQDLGHVPNRKIRVEVVNNAAELAKVSTLTLEQIRKTGTIAICKWNKLMVTSPKAVLRGYDWLDTLSHEYIHLVVSQKSRNTVPIWLHEGMAKYLESRWRGEAGLAMSPSTLALLGDRVKRNKLIRFEEMHPSIALLPSAEDAATAFAEVFFAIDLIYREHGAAGLRKIIAELAAGKTDKQAVEAATGSSFGAFEKAWLGHVRRQQFPDELLPLTAEKKVLKEDKPGVSDEKKGRDINFGDFIEVEETAARKFAHLGELMRERNRPGAAAEEFAKAHEIVKDRYESISNKFALTLLQLRRLEEAERVLQGSLRVHPGSPATNVHLGRIYLTQRDYPRARAAFLEALATNPFDEEIHLALSRIHQAMGAPELARRATLAAATLTRLPVEQLEAVIQQLDKRTDLSQEPGAAPPAEPATDAGTPVPNR